MSQISMPMRILLIGAAVFLAAWFTVLKPGGAEEAVPPVQPANVTTPAPAANAAATPGAAQDTTVAATAIPADVLAQLPKDVAKAITERKTLVLGVFAEDASNWRSMADDDRYVRNALKKTNRYDGEVFAKNIGLAELSTYGPLVNELGVTQSPAVVVIDRNLKGTVLTGYVDRVAINQAIADARRDSIDPAITDEFLSAANEICSRFNVRLSRWSLPTINGHKARGKAADRLAKIYFEQLGAVMLLDAPAKYQSLKTAWTDKLVGKIFDHGGEGLAFKARDAKLAKRMVASETFKPSEARKLDRRFDTLGVGACVEHRRS